MKDKRMKYSIYTTYVSNEKGALMINCKTGAIVYINKEMEQQCVQYMNEGFVYDSEDEMQKILAEKEFFIRNEVNEKDVAKKEYEKYVMNIYNPKKYLGITVDLGSENKFMSENNIRLFWKALNNYLDRYSPEQIIITVIVSKGCAVKDFVDSFHNIVANINIIINVVYNDCFDEFLLDELSDKVTKVVWNIDEQNKELLYQIQKYPKQKGIKYNLFIKCLYTKNANDETSLLDNNIMVKYIVKKDISNSNINQSVLNDIYCLERLQTKEALLGQLDWFRRWGLVCEYTLPFNYYLDVDLNIYKCREHVANENIIGKIFNETFFVDVDNHINLNVNQKCIDCNWFYVCMGHSCIVKEKLVCPLKFMITDEFFLSLLNEVQMK